jgi:hypothetical protein
MLIKQQTKKNTQYSIDFFGDIIVPLVLSMAEYKSIPVKV